MSRKIKVFLYAHINQIGAFNLSARYLAEHLGKEDFDIYTLALSKGTLGIPKYKGVKVFNCFYPAKISNFMGIIWGVYYADVVFVMRGNHYKLKISGKKSFKRQGNKIDDSVISSIASAVGGESNIPSSFNFCDKVYAPSLIIGNYNAERWDIKYETDYTLPPFINVAGFLPSKRQRRKVKNVVFIGNDMIRKNIEFFLELALKNPLLSFNVIGKSPYESFFEEAPKNLNYIGVKNPEELNSFLDDMDLHCFTSRSEGFGKVTIELAEKGIPSILFDDYGAKEWLKSEKEGWIVSSENEYLDALSHLVSNPSKYQELIEGLPSLLERFSMKNQLRQYEEVIQYVYAS
jgi:glycosyltransferase involved in cell wall biosynthesis